MTYFCSNLAVTSNVAKPATVSVLRYITGYKYEQSLM